MYGIAQEVRRYTASGALFGEGEKVVIAGILINCLSGDATVNIYDNIGVSQDYHRFGAHRQPGTSDFYPVCFAMDNGGYIQIVGTAEVFIYFL